MMDSTHRVRAILSFVQAVNSGSFAAAGRMMGISSAGVSKNVAGLERALGVRLLNRTTRTLVLTEEGRIFLRKARIALEALDAAVDTVAAQNGEPNGRIRISTSVNFGERHLLPILPCLLERYPGLAVDVDFEDRVVDLVGGGYDLAIRGGHIRDSALVSRPICRLNTALVAAPPYLARYGIPASIDELRSHRLVSRRFLGTGVASWSFKANGGSIITLDPTDSAVLTVSSPEALVEAACQGVGIAEVAVHLARQHLESGRLKVLMHQFHHPGIYELALQYPHRAFIAPRVRVAVDFLLDAFAADDALHIPLSSLTHYQAENP